MAYQAEYSRKMNKSSLILTMDKDGGSDKDSIGMFQYNQIPNFLNMQMIRNNEKEQFCYDITGRRSLEQLLEYKTLDHLMLEKILNAFDQACIQAEDYLLTESDILLKPEFVFADSDSEQMQYCYLPGNQMDICRQFQEFMEYLLQRLNHKDEDAVQLAYGVYQCVTEEKASLHGVLKEFRKGGAGLKIYQKKDFRMENQKKEAQAVKNPVSADSTECGKLSDGFDISAEQASIPVYAYSGYTNKKEIHGCGIKAQMRQAEIETPAGIYEKSQNGCGLHTIAESQSYGCSRCTGADTQSIGSGGCAGTEKFSCSGCTVIEKQGYNSGGCAGTEKFSGAGCTVIEKQGYNSGGCAGTEKFSGRADTQSHRYSYNESAGMENERFSCSGCADAENIGCNGRISTENESYGYSGRINIENRSINSTGRTTTEKQSIGRGRRTGVEDQGIGSSGCAGVNHQAIGSSARTGAESKECRNESDTDIKKEKPEENKELKSQEKQPADKQRKWFRALKLRQTETESNKEQKLLNSTKLQQKEAAKNQAAEKLKKLLRRKIYTDSFQYEQEDDYLETVPEEEPIVSNPTVCLMPETDGIQNRFVYQGMDRTRDFQCMPGKMILGSSSQESDICIPLPMISRVHARIVVDKDGTFLEDMNSTNGTQVNGELLNYREQRILHRGDIVSLAGECYSFH